MRDADYWLPEAVFQCGNFTIYYEDIHNPDLENSGFDDIELGESRRNTLCSVLAYVESILEIHPNANAGIFVDFSFSEQIPAPFGVSFLAVAGPYFSVEDGNSFGIDAGIYNGNFFNYLTTGQDPDSNFDYDGYLKLNFDAMSFSYTHPDVFFTIDEDLTNPASDLPKYDLYTVLLHEITHMLGLTSEIGEDLNYDVICKNEANSFTRFDWTFGYFGEIGSPGSFLNQKFIIGSQNSPFINPIINAIDDYPLRRSKVWLNAEGPPNNHNIFAGLPPATVLSPLDFENEFFKASFMSHLGSKRGNLLNQQFSPGKYLPYVMKPTLTFQELIRDWSLPEIRLLRTLGYELNQNFLTSNSLNSEFPNSEIVNNSPPFRSDYSIPDKLIYPVDMSLNDFIENSEEDESIVNSNTINFPSTSVLTIDISTDLTFVDIDNDPISVLPTSIFGIRGVSLGGNNHERVSLDQSGTVFTFTPEVGFFGRAEFAFYLWDGKEIGAIEVYTINVIKDENLTFSDELNLIINGDFEDGMEIRTWEHPLQNNSASLIDGEFELYSNIGLGGGHPWSMDTRPIILHSFDPPYQVYDGYGLNGGGFGGYGSWIYTCPSFIGLYAPYPSSQMGNNLRFLGHQLAADQLVVSGLIQPMASGEPYKLQMDLGCITPYNEIGDLLEGIELHVIEDPNSSNFVSIQEIVHNIEVQSLIEMTEPSEWPSVEIPFLYCGELNANYILIKLIDSSIICNIDNLVLKKDINYGMMQISAGEDQFVSNNCPQAFFETEVEFPRCDMSYSWTPTSDLSDPTIPNPVASPTITTTYTITVTDALTGQTAFDEITVYVIDNVTNTGNITLCLGDPAVNLFDNVSVPGGDFIIPGNPTITLADGIFDPANFGLGSYTAIYTVGVEPCQSITFFGIQVQGYTPLTATHPDGLIVTDNGPNDGQTLSGNRQFLQDLVIQSGAVYTISAGIIQFAEGKGIRIMPGGRLVVQNNSMLREIDCGTDWLGIRVHGVGNLSQEGPQAASQGRLTMRNSEVRNALVGVSNYGILYQNSTYGGITYVQDSKFTDCRISVHNERYNNIYLSVSYPVRSTFYNSQFDLTANYPFVNAVNNPMILLSGVKGIIISGCKFKNLHPSLFATPNNSQNKAAVLATSSSILLSKGCNGAPPYAINSDGSCVSGDVTSTFKGFQYGVVLQSSNGSSITNTAFNCYRGVWAINAKALRLTQNSFSSLPAPFIPFMNPGPSPFNPYWPIPYGAYLESSTSYWVEANSFNYPSISGEAGLIVRGSGGGYHQIYDNNFTSTYFGVISYDDNRGTNPNSGLKIECNNFTQNNRGVIVVPTTTAPPSGWGISHTQGMPAQGLNLPFPAGNVFSTTPLSVQNNLDFVTYYRHSSEMVPSASGNVGFVNLPVQNDCPSNFGGGIVEKSQMASIEKNIADSLSNVLLAIIDDGNTVLLTDEVIYAEYAQAVELYYDLMQISPNLSEEVMIEAIKKEYELPAALLTLILSSNPHAAKSEKLQRELNERVQPLAAYQRDMINQGLDLVSYKEGIEARESYHRAKSFAWIDQLVIEALADSTGLSTTANVEAIITGYETPEYAYLLVDLDLQKGNLIAAQSRLNQLALNFDLDARQDAELSDYLAVYETIIDLTTTGDSTLSLSQLASLEEISIKNSTRAAGLAAITLAQYADYQLLETLVEPIEASPKLNSTPPKNEPNLRVCKVYPNPTAGILIVDIPKGYVNVLLTITDINGRVILESKGMDGLNTLNLREASNGSYQLIIRSLDGILSESHTIQLTK